MLDNIRVQVGACLKMWTWWRRLYLFLGDVTGFLTELGILTSGRHFLFLRTMTSIQNPPLPTIALPGQPLASSTQYKPGPGTHLPSSNPNTVHASIFGQVSTIPSKKGPSIISVVRQSQTAAPSSLLPKEGNIILGRVTRISIREARVQILVINDVPVMEEFAGVIRYRPCSRGVIDYG